MIAKRVDYSNQSSIVEALRDQDALIITLAVTAPDDQESKLIHAAAEANVPWVFPNEWSPDMANESLSKDILIGENKKKHRDLIVELGKSSFVAVSTGFWYEWSLAITPAFGFDFANRAVTLFDDGETRINTATWPQVGRAMASLLSLPVHPDKEEDSSLCLDRFKNDFVYVSSFTVSQKDMLDSVVRVTQTSLDDWTVTKESVQDRYRAGLDQLMKGDRVGFVKMLYARVFFPDGSGNVKETKGLHDDLLGLPKEDIDEYTKIAIQRAKEAN